MTKLPEQIANTPEPPYYAVIFSTTMHSLDDDYLRVAGEMEELAKKLPGYLGIESARTEVGITVSYWRDLESIRNWKNNADHQMARKRGKEQWYASYKLRICKVEKDYHFVR